MFPDPLLVLGGAALRACSGFAVTPAPVRVSSLPLSPSAAGPRSGFGSAAASPRRLPRGRSSYKVTASLRFRALRSQPRIWAQVICFPARAEEDSGQSERDALASCVPRARHALQKSLRRPCVVTRAGSSGGRRTESLCKDQESVFSAFSLPESTKISARAAHEHRPRSSTSGIPSQGTRAGARAR